VDSARNKALAWRYGEHEYDSHRYSGKSRWKTVEWMEQVSDQQYRSSQSTTGGVGGGEASAAPKLMRDFDPKLAELTNNVLYGDIWERPGLSKRDQSLITVAAMIALNRPEQLRSHLQRARDNGVTKDEVVEMTRTWPSMQDGLMR
jgi:4-carboxymuconolactone decarboxylase